MLTPIKDKRTRRLLPGLSIKDGYTPHPFDLEHGVKTSGLIAGRNLSTGHAHDRHNTAYYGVAPSVFRALMKRWQRSQPVAPIEEFTFIDFGAGMGRALLLASELSFREVVGVEIHPTLFRIAQKNLIQWRAAGRTQVSMRIVLEDVVQFEFPPNPCLLFLFNPFGATVLRRVMASIAKAFAEGQDSEPGQQEPGQLDLIYVNHEHEHVLEQNAGLRRLYLGQVPRSRVDAIADHSILANQPEGEYASSNYEDCSIHRWVGKTGRARQSREN